MTDQGFFFDSAACSGCKACQMACKDKHHLPIGVNWRRVYEVTGGSWKQVRSAWVPEVYAYYLSIACNHCIQPVCAEVCPTAAITRRTDGIVLINADRCVGCGYCAWACPYGAPQLDSQQGVMTKCTLCYDELEAGRPPACVAACPLRSLDLMVRRVRPAAQPGEYPANPYPLPDPGFTEPVLFIKPHPGVYRRPSREAEEPGADVRLEEAQPERGWHLAPLVGFTVFMQAAVGMFLWLVLFAGVGAMRIGIVRSSELISAAYLPVLSLAGGAMVVSLLHLGRPLRALEALRNWRSSWLSREIIASGGFILSVAAALLLSQSETNTAHILLPVMLVSGCSWGCTLLFCMGRLYTLKTVPAWSGIWTWAAFLPTPFLLGIPLGMAVLLFNAPGLIMAANPAGRLLRIFLECGALVMLLVSIITAAFLGVNRIKTPSLKLDIIAGFLCVGAGFCINHLAKAAHPPASGSLAALAILFGAVFLIIADIGRRFVFYRSRRTL